MTLWIEWLQTVRSLRPACSRSRTFFWMVFVLMGLCSRADNAGVTSFVRVLNFRGDAYHRFLHLFHSKGIARSHGPFRSSRRSIARKLQLAKRSRVQEKPDRLRDG